MMQGSRNRQRGISFFGLLLAAVIVGFIVLIGLKLFPVYMESWKIDSAMKSLVQDPQIAEMSKRDISRSLIKRLDIDDVKSVTEGNRQDTIRISKNDKKVIIQIQYQRVQPLFSNLSVLADFDKIVEN